MVVTGLASDSFILLIKCELVMSYKVPGSKNSKEIQSKMYQKASSKALQIPRRNKIQT